MTGSRYEFRRSKALVFVLLLAAPLALAAPCRRPPSGKPAETNVVFVQFKGCAVKDPPTIRIGVDPLTFIKVTHQEFGVVWKATTAESFPVTRPPELEIDTPANVRTACKVVPKDQDAAPGCVMLYPVYCEPVWILNVNASTKPTIGYARQPKQHTVQSCTPPPVPDGLGDVELTHSEGVEMSFRIPKHDPIPVPLSLSSFGSKRTTLTVRDLNPKCVGRNPAEDSRACVALMKTKIEKVAAALLLTKTVTP